MKIHEYQGKELFRKFGMVTPRGFPCFSVDEAVEAAKKLGGQVVLSAFSGLGIGSTHYSQSEASRFTVDVSHFRFGVHMRRLDSSTPQILLVQGLVFLEPLVDRHR